MKPVRLLSLLCLAAFLLMAGGAAARAQMPTDNDAWKARCDTLRNADPTGRGNVPAWLRQAPKGIPGPQFTTFGWDRLRATQPYVACTFFYLGAIADHNAPRTHANHVHAHESAVMGRIAAQTGHHQQVSVREGLTRAHAEAAEIPKPPLTIPEEEAIVAAASTMPLTPAEAAQAH
jgi:hypothetical protein